VWEARLEKTLLNMIWDDLAGSGPRDKKQWRSAARDAFDRMGDSKSTFYRKLDLSGWKWESEIVDWILDTIAEYWREDDAAAPDWRPSRRLSSIPRRLR
jgi:hypothetical protein